MFSMILGIEYLRVFVTSTSGSISPVNFLAIGTYSIIIICSISSIRKFLFKKYIPIVMFWFIYLASSIFSVLNIEVEPKFVILTVFKVFAILLVVTRIKSANNLYVVVSLIIFAGIIDTLLNLFDLGGVEKISGVRDLGNIPWLRYDAIWLSISVIVSIVLVNDKKKQKTSFRRYFDNSILLVLFLFVFISIIQVQLRVFIIEGLVGLFIGILISRKSNFIKILPRIIFLSICALIVWHILPVGTKENIVEGLWGRDDGGRTELWSYSTRLWLESPMFGHGFGSDGVLLKSFELAGRQSSHNVYLAFLVETGVVGLTWWLYLNVISIRKEVVALSLATNRNDIRFLFAMIIMHITMMVHIFFHGLIYFPWVVILPLLGHIENRNLLKRYDSAKHLT